MTGTKLLEICAKGCYKGFCVQVWLVNEHGRLTRNGVAEQIINRGTKHVSDAHRNMKRWFASTRLQITHMGMGSQAEFMGGSSLRQLTRMAKEAQFLAKQARHDPRKGSRLT